MITKKSTTVVTFVTDQKGINQLKNEFYNEAREYIYFRKGEWHGVDDSIRNAIQWAKNNPDWIAERTAGYKPSKELINKIKKATGANDSQIKKYFGKRKKKGIDHRVICGPSISKKDITRWEKICGIGSVVTVPKAQIGEFRYLVNDNRYAIFSRIGPEKLLGIIGTDERMLSALRDTFMAEFIIEDIKKQCRRKRKKK